ncbi:hypothetical protein ABHA37_08105 [Clostridium tertium]|uniref:hypothetical protein n=1 Tax=Clostridium tertium TaxID=1559 RepID=UPI00232DA86C|nr:hypothetical protein [Clostridium tertium]MDB1923375.1 hypothetical protein [Clostridium tertium]MDB1929980.1 hypothetical protein [Clostridium tertium]
MEIQISFWDKYLIFTEDDTELNSEFTKGSVWKYNFEHENNFIIFLSGIYYGPLKDNCMKLS